jgi:methylated-DNA-[protein]-cysteine S-methyltransferase
MKLAETTFLSPLGRLRLIAQEDALVGVYFEAHRPAPPALHTAPARDHAVLDAARVQLEEYFAGARTAFSLPLAAVGTAFQRDVWRALRAIPFGHTRSYGELGAQIGKPLASRAVGAANGRNPLSIIVPCHRVIGASGALTGYAGGAERKRWLLGHEQNGSAARIAASH